MIEQVTGSALAPFLDPVGWQGFAYGLLGIKSIRKMMKMAKNWTGGNGAE